LACPRFLGQSGSNMSRLLHENIMPNHLIAAISLMFQAITPTYAGH
jgi:hypothetical protein